MADSFIPDGTEADEKMIDLTQDELSSSDNGEMDANNNETSSDDAIITIASPLLTDATAELTGPMETGIELIFILID